VNDAGASATCMMVWRHFVEPAMASSWSSSSWSTPIFLADLVAWNLSAIIRTGEEAEYAVFSRRPRSRGPARARPPRRRLPPPARAYPSAI